MLPAFLFQGKPKTLEDWVNFLCDLLDQSPTCPRAIHLGATLTGDPKALIDLAEQHWTLYNTLWCDCHTHSEDGKLEPVKMVFPAMANDGDETHYARWRGERRALIRVLYKLIDRDPVAKFLFTAVTTQGTYARLVIDNGRPMIAMAAANARSQFDIKKQTQVKLSKWLQSAAFGAHKEAAIEQFSYLMAVNLGVKIGDFELLKGQAIVDAYSKGVGKAACMSGSKAVYTNLYAANPDRVQMLVFSTETIKARALFWTSDDGKVKLLDRIYPEQGIHVQLMQQWIYDQGGYIRSHHGAPSNERHNEKFVNEKGKEPPPYTITLKPADVSALGVKSAIPYIDSWRSLLRTAKGLVLLSDWEKNVSQTSAPYIVCRSGEGQGEEYDTCHGCHTSVRTHHLGANGLCGNCGKKVTCHKCRKVWISNIHEPGWELVMNGKKKNTCAACIGTPAVRDAEPVAAMVAAVDDEF